MSFWIGMSVGALLMWMYFRLSCLIRTREEWLDALRREEENPS